MDQNFILIGLVNVFTVTNLLAILIGTAIGLVVGAMPGLSATMAIALLLPLTFRFPPETGLSLLASLYIAAMYGGSIAAILLRTPGTPAAAATVLDGYPMAARGEAGRALGLSLSSSLVGGILSGFALLTVAPLLGLLVLRFGPVELFALAVFGLTIIASLSHGSTIRGLFAGALGLLIATVGMDVTTGTARFTFGHIELFSGVPFVVALIGLFSIPQAIRLMEQSQTGGPEVISRIRDRVMPRFKEFMHHFPNMLRSSAIGIVTGTIPGTGGDTASWLAYNEARRFSKNKEEFGKGAPAGIVAPEAANNAVVGGALIPTIALGIPGSSSTAVLLGGLLVHGIQPGPTLMTQHGAVTYTLIWAVIFANLALFVIGIGFTKVCVSVTQIPNKVVAPVIVVLCVIGSYAINNNMFDVYLMLGFGFLGYVFDRLAIPTAPLVIGLILGNLLESNLQRSLLIGHGDWLIFFSSPISAVLLILAFLSVLQSMPLFRNVFLRRRKPATRQPADAGDASE
jgi:putative tricarboxylic transport membrane protein